MVPVLDLEKTFIGQDATEGITLINRQGIYHENPGAPLSAFQFGTLFKPPRKPLNYGFWIDTEQCFPIETRNKWDSSSKVEYGARNIPELCEAQRDHVGNQARISNWTFSSPIPPSIKLENKYEPVLLGTNDEISHFDNIKDVFGNHLARALLQKDLSKPSTNRWFSDRIEFLERDFAVSFSSGTAQAQITHALIGIERRNGFVAMAQSRDILCAQKLPENEKWQVGLVLKSAVEGNKFYFFGKNDVGNKEDVKEIFQGVFKVRHSLLGAESPIFEVLHTIIFRKDREVFNIGVNSLEKGGKVSKLKNETFQEYLIEGVEQKSILEEKFQEQITLKFLEEVELREAVASSLRQRALRNHRISDQAAWSVAITTGILAGCSIVAAPSITSRRGAFLVLFEFAAGVFVAIFAILEGSDIGGLYISPLIRNRRFFYGTIYKDEETSHTIRCGRLDTSFALGGVELIDSRFLWVSMFCPVLLFIFASLFYKLYRGYQKYKSTKLDMRK